MSLSLARPVISTTTSGAAGEPLPVSLQPDLDAEVMDDRPLRYQPGAGERALQGTLYRDPGADLEPGVAK